MPMQSQTYDCEPPLKCIRKADTLSPRGPVPFFDPETVVGGCSEKKAVVVIGAGCAGLTVAKNLLETGKFCVTVLEAREVSGGRCRTQKFDRELSVESKKQLVADMGPEFIGSQHDYINKFLDELGLRLTPVAETDSEEAGLELTPREEEIVTQVKEVARKLLPDFAVRKEQGESGNSLHGQDIDLATLYRDLDSVTMEEFVKRKFNVESSESLKKLGLDLANQMGVKMDGISALHVLLELAGWAEEVGSPVDARIVGGATALTDGLTSKFLALGGEIRYGAVVSEIQQLNYLERQAQGVAPSGAIVKICESSETFLADAVIVTAPLPCLRDIHFTSSVSAEQATGGTDEKTQAEAISLPPLLQRAIEDVNYGDILKIAIEFGQRWWCPSGEMHPRGKAFGDMSGVIYECTNFANGGLDSKAADEEQNNSDGGILMAYLTPPLSDEIRAIGNKSEQIERVLDLLETEKLPPGLTRKDMQFRQGFVQDWRGEKNTGGGVYAVFGPQQHSIREYLQSGPQLGCVHFCGEHTSFWQGYMNGAIESGHRVSWTIWNQFFATPESAELGEN